MKDETPAVVQYPKAMHKGSETKDVQTADEEKDLRKDGWIDGHEYFSQQAEKPGTKLEADPKKKAS